MNTYVNMKKVIATGKKTDAELLTMCDVFYMNNRITQEQYTELVIIINEQ